MRKLFNDNWQFALMPLDGIPVESNYKSVDIPHDWQIYNTHDLYSTGDGFYRKHFTLTNTSGKVYSLRFEGVYMDSEVSLNGEKIFEWKYGYTTFVVPLKNVREGENVILVRVIYHAPIPAGTPVRESTGRSGSARQEKTALPKTAPMLSAL